MQNRILLTIQRYDTIKPTFSLEEEIHKTNKLKGHHKIILKEKTINRIKNIEEITNIGSGILSSVNPAFSIIPILLMQLIGHLD